MSSYAEEFVVDTGRHLGNLPQAFSDLDLVEGASRIIPAGRLAEIHGSARRLRLERARGRVTHVG